MKNYVHSKYNQQGRITIGLISENSANEFENKMREGIIEAAREQNVNLICFTQLEMMSKDSVSYGKEAERYRHIHKILRQLVDEFDIDGLLFMGWSTLLDGDHSHDFKKHFAHIPLLSLGKQYHDVPSVYCEGGIQLRELLVHLINQHDYRKIVFIESWKRDTRMDYYIQTMQENNLLDNDLIVTAGDLEGISILDRSSRALDILAARNAKFDVIVVMRAEDSRLMLSELRSRGLRVPEDVALTSYEEDISLEFSEPPMTTIYFPFKELGYMGCSKLVELLRVGEIDHTTLIESHIIIRGSCGCVEQVNELSKLIPNPIGIDPELEQAFHRSVERDSTELITILQNRLRQNRVNYYDYQRHISILRNKYSFYLESDMDKVERSENLWHLARLVISESERSWAAKDMFRTRSTDEILEQFSQTLLNSFSMPRILSVLDIYLRRLQIPTCNVFLCGDEGPSQFTLCKHIFGMIDNQRIAITQEQVNTRAYHNEFVQVGSSSRILVVSLLYVEQSSIGYMCFEVGPIEGLLYLRIAILFGNALAGSFMVDKLTSEISLRKEKEDELSFYAHFDTHTRLLNRRTFYESVALMEENTPFCIFYFDLDGFKMVNDSFGHAVGDQILLGVVERIKAVIFQYVIHIPKDYVTNHGDEVGGIYRVGGDEFTAILEYPDPVKVATLANALIEQLREPYYINNIRIGTTCSLGISCYPSHTNDRIALIKFADTAMYYAKKEGGNAFKYFNTEMEEEAQQKLEIGNLLHQALEREELSLYYQPQVDIHRGVIIGVEALLRWNQPAKGSISPAVFIPIAEEIGLIIPIGEWVIRQACKQMKLWLDVGVPVMRIAVNLSVLQFLDGRLIEKVTTILKDTGLDPSYLELEITENVAMKDEQLIVLRELRNLGIAIAIDDFGTEYSSLSYLKRFPVTKLKLDQSFIRGIESDNHDREMIKAIIFVAKSFNLDIIAEGVEKSEEVEFLFDNGCFNIQGFYYYKPMEAVDINRIFERAPNLKFSEHEETARNELSDDR